MIVHDSDINFLNDTEYGNVVMHYYSMYKT